MCARAGNLSREKSGGREFPAAPARTTSIKQLVLGVALVAHRPLDEGELRRRAVVHRLRVLGLRPALVVRGGIRLAADGLVDARPDAFGRQELARVVPAGHALEAGGVRAVAGEAHDARAGVRALRLAAVVDRVER